MYNVFSTHTMLVRNFCASLNVSDLESGVCWGFQPDQFGLWGEETLKVLSIIFGEIAKREGDAKFLRNVSKVSLRASVHIIYTNAVISRLKHVQDGAGAGKATGKHETMVSIFQFGKTFCVKCVKRVKCECVKIFQKNLPKPFLLDCRIWSTQTVLCNV